MRQSLIKFNSMIAVASVFCSLTLSSMAAFAQNTEVSADHQVDQSASTFAIVTGKEGLGSGLAHRHIIVAKDISGAVKLISTKHNAQTVITGGSAEVSFPVSRLSVDQANEAAPAMRLFSDAGFWNAAADKIEPKNSETVRDNMLDESQLDAARAPVIKGSGILSGCLSQESQLTVCTLALTVTVKSKSVTKSVPVKLTGADGSLTAVFTAPFTFTEFGIKPYSAMFGAIRVSDAFTLGAVLKVK